MSMRFKIATGFFLFVWLIIALRLWVVTSINHEYYDKYAQKNATKVDVLVPIRGQILDRNNEPLAINELGFAIAITPRLKSSLLQEQIELIVKYFPFLDSQKLTKTYTNANTSYNHAPIVVVDFLAYREIQHSFTYLKQSPHIVVMPTSKRFYPNESSASHIIGYVSKANQSDMDKNPLSFYTKVMGKMGIESQYNDFLQGEASYRKTQINALHKEVKVLQEAKPLRQNNLTLTLDLRLQELIDSEFTDKEGAVVVLDVHNGEILAAGSYPEYNLNDFIGGISTQKWRALLENPHYPLVNKMIAGQYPPGSVIKMAMGLAFLEFGEITEHTTIETPCYIELGGRKYRDWKCGHKSADLFKAIKSSVNVYFYKLSMQVGISNVATVLSQMGFGKKTGIDIPHEKSGVVPTPEWKLRAKGENWVTGDLVNTSIGQGYFLVTPMQVARYTALIASGKFVTPHFAKMFNETPAQYEVADVLSTTQKQKLNALRKGMYQVCNSADGGTVYWRTRGAKVPIACKTGTAQVTGIPQDMKTRIKEHEMEYFARSHAWITAFVPYNEPKYAITIMLEHGGSGGNGGPILVNIVNKLYDLGYIN